MARSPRFGIPSTLAKHHRPPVSGRRAKMSFGFRLNQPPVTWTSHERFPDHSVLKARFQVGKEFALMYLWPMPSQCPGPKFLMRSLQWILARTDLYAQLWHCKEQQAKTSLARQWHPQMQGRGQRTTPLQRRGWAAPPKKGRSMDFQHAFHGHSVQHARWMKQLRRLHNYKRWAASHYGSATSTEALHGLYLWKSIRNVSSIGHSFAKWWISRESIGFGDLGFVPDYPPNAAVAQALCDTFQGEVAA